MAMPRRSMLDLGDPNAAMGDPGAVAGMEGDPTAAGLPPGVGSTDQLSTGDLSALGGTGMDTVDADQAQQEQLMQQLEDPNTDPALRAQLQQRLALAARRRLAGLGDTTTPMQ